MEPLCGYKGEAMKTTHLAAIDAAWEEYREAGCAASVAHRASILLSHLDEDAMEKYRKADDAAMAALRRYAALVVTR